MWCFEIWSRAWDLAPCLCVNRYLLRRFASLACPTWNRGTLWFSLCKMILLFPVPCHPSSALCFQIRFCMWMPLSTMSLTFRKFFEHLDMMDKVHRAHPLLREMDLSKSMCEDVTRYVWYSLMFLIHSIVCPLYGIALAKLQGDPSLGTCTFDSFNRRSSGLNFVGFRPGTIHCSDVCIECQNCHTLKN